MNVVVIVYGMPSELKDTVTLNRLVMTSIPSAVTKVADNLPDDCRIITFVPKDMLLEGLGEELVAFVDAPLEGQRLVSAVSQAIGEALVSFAKKEIANCQSVDVLPSSRSFYSGDFHWKAG